MVILPSVTLVLLSGTHCNCTIEMIQPLFICLTFSVSTLHKDSSDPPLTQELYAFRTYRPKHLDIAHFPMLLLLSGIVCLMKLRHTQSTTAFKTPLKTHLFKSYLR